MLLSNTFALRKLKGATKFHKPFTKQSSGQFNLKVYTLRERVVEPLVPFFSQRKQKVTQLLTTFTEFLQEAQLFRIYKL